MTAGGRRFYPFGMVCQQKVLHGVRSILLGIIDGGTQLPKNTPTESSDWLMVFCLN